MGQLVALGRTVVQHILPYFIINVTIYGTLQSPSSIHHIILLKDKANVQEMENHLEHQQDVLQLLKDNLVIAQNMMKQQADQHCSERKFEVGDWVFFRLQPYKQISLEQQKKDNKLAPNYYGPYKVLPRIRSIAYELELPPSSCVHPIFHVS